MDDDRVNWDDILEVGLGGPGCGLLKIDGREPRGNYRYLPPALFHDGKVYASSFVSGGFMICVIDPESLVRQELSRRLPYARLKAIEAGEIVYFDHHSGDSESRLPITPRTPRLAGLAARLRRR
ncbi:hypothetical protein [Sphingomonas sp. 28-63-12]|uniref:hypothetical protein n=1 Tax=Sphingomonas sp. 28-63-12 TaxID=1970434 RepID=UPI0035A96881